jgi:hypothetical protein
VWSVIGVVATAVVGALATAIITPESLRSWFTGDEQSVEYHRVDTLDGTLAFEVPAAWAANDSDFDEFDGTVGPGLTAGIDPSLPENSVQSKAFLGASRVRTGDLGTGAELSAALTERLHADDWTLDGCTFDGESSLETEDGLRGPYRIWRGCSSTDLSLYEAWLAPADGSYVAVVQVQVTGDGADEIAEHVLATVQVRPERLEEGSDAAAD